MAMEADCTSGSSQPAEVVALVLSFDGKEKLMSLGKYRMYLCAGRERTPRRGNCWRQALTDGTTEGRKDCGENRGREHLPERYHTMLEHWEREEPRHVDSVRRRMEADILPCLGARPIAEIEAPELVAMANAIQDRGARILPNALWRRWGRFFATASPTLCKA